MLLKHGAVIISQNLNYPPPSRRTLRSTTFFSLCALLCSFSFVPIPTLSTLCPLLCLSPPFFRAMPSLSRHLAKPHNPTYQQQVPATRRRPRGTQNGGGGRWPTSSKRRFWRNNAGFLPLSSQLLAVKYNMTLTLRGHVSILLRRKVQRRKVPGKRHSCHYLVLSVNDGDF